MTNTMVGAHLCTPQSVFQQMMNQQNSQQQQIGPWMQMPQVPPISIPWSVPGLQQSELVRFTGETSSGPVLHQKRKLEAPDIVDMHQTKQFITEEKITAHFKDLHISSNYESNNPVPSTSTAHTASPCYKQLNTDLDDSTKTINAEQTSELHPRLVLSEELKRMQEEPILPSTLISKLERPSMALVLWEPPNRHLRILPTRDTPTPIPNTSDDNNNNNNNNNNETIPDLNNMLSNATSAFEPMEL
ncbi:rho GTPase-activating protein gacHH isoform X2 [Monomorium pharaonis]|uniref:rho GTPase-activating protein gacHH isoform X2 n=1 Tax=Monomorium pharaonis TaxID=307658 RepID=UPI00063FA723|nr:rho GTPase-activating protein gacHH isoform X2 [Monomorium pharaonis]XP_036141964.1 rho GTPase-activating protein gacHH isoform X2 [Monomorium pharaonis]